MQRFSIRSVLLLVVYFAVCSLVYVSTNIWLGWLVVFATAIVYATAMKRAFSTRDRSVLVFAISGTVALITMLGFAIETRGIPSQLKAHDLRRTIQKHLRLSPLPDAGEQQKTTVNNARILHHMYYSIGIRERRHPPGWINLARLLVAKKFWHKVVKLK